MWWLLGVAIWAVLLVVIIALCRVAANADRAASKAFAAIERAERQKLYTLAVERRDRAA
jgi:uncharacterized membrane protein YvbJ